jgi:DegV family protein with EDD domain
MAARVAVVTDSTASLPPGVADELLTIVPLHVVIDGFSRAEGGPGLSGEVADALRENRKVTTSQPPVEQFEETYRSLFAAGAEEIVSVHLSSDISGTCAAARIAAERMQRPVRVVDSRTIAMAAGFAALAGARAAQTGTADDVIRVVGERAARARTYFSPASLDYLRRGGRIGAASAMLGSVLAVRPILQIGDGVVQPYERVRTVARARARLAELAAEAAEELGTVEIAVHHLDDADGADELAVRLAGMGDGLVQVAEVSAVLGVHVGPGTLGVAISPRLEYEG